MPTVPTSPATCSHSWVFANRSDFVSILVLSMLPMLWVGSEPWLSSLAKINLPKSLGRRLAGVFFELFQSCLMPAPFELRFDPNLDHAVDELFAEQISRQAQDVGVVVPTAHFGGQIVVTQGGAHAVKPIGGNRHADARAADQNAAFDIVRDHRRGDFRGEFRVIDAVGRVGTEIDPLVPKVGQLTQNLLLHLVSAMVAGNCDFHDGHSGNLKLET